MNFQNIPRSNKLIKKAFRPKLDAFACFDYEQIEYRLLAYYLAESVGDSSMAEAFRAGIDAHSATAELILGRPVASDDDRQIGKTANFSIIYAGGVPTILRQMAKAGIECDRSTAKAWLKELHARMPGVRELNSMIMEEIQGKGYIYDIFGRRYHPDPKIPWRDAVRKLLNALIQGCAAGMTREALVSIADELKKNELKSHMVNVVHDEIIMDCVEEELPILHDNMEAWMGNSIVEPIVPITVGMEVSFETWADKEPYARK